MIQIQSYRKESFRHIDKIYEIGNPDPVEIIPRPPRHTYHCTLAPSPDRISVGDKVTLIGNTIKKVESDFEKPIGYVLSLSGDRDAVIDFVDDPDFDFEEERILRKAW